MAAAARDQRELSIVLTDNTDRQKRSRDEVLRETFIVAGISNLSTDSANRYSPFGKALHVMQDREVFLCKSLCLRYRKQYFFELRTACQRRANLWRELGKIGSLEKPLDSQLKVHFPDMPVVQVDLHVLGAELVPTLGKNFRAKSIMTWQVNSGYGTSCALAYQ